MNVFKKILLIAGLSLVSLSSAHAAYQTYTSEASFRAAVTGARTDDFDSLSGVTLSNAEAQASSVANIGYVSTAFPDWNIYTSGYLCWGCNGSGYMDLSATDLGTVGGVYGFMTHYDYNYSGTKAFVTFADGATADFGLDYQGLLAITSSDLISKVEFSSVRNQSSYGVIAFADVTVANAGAASDVPEPASLALLGLGLLGAVAARRRK